MEYGFVYRAHSHNNNNNKNTLTKTGSKELNKLINTTVSNITKQGTQ